jgi:ankyrin repeat protein
LGHAIENDSIEIIKILVENGAGVNALCEGDTTALWKAVSIGSIEVVVYLVENGADINQTDNGGFTALFRATQWDGPIEIIKYLIETGADINHTNDAGYTALFEAVYSNNIDVIRFLVEAGADINHKDSDGTTPFTIAIIAEIKEIEEKTKIINYFISNGANIAQTNRRSTDGDFEGYDLNVWEAALFEHNLKLVKYLLISC